MFINPLYDPEFHFVFMDAASTMRNLKFQYLMQGKFFIGMRFRLMFDFVIHSKYLAFCDNLLF